MRRRRRAVCTGHARVAAVARRMGSAIRPSRCRSAVAVLAAGGNAARRLPERSGFPTVTSDALIAATPDGASDAISPPLLGTLAGSFGGIRSGNNRDANSAARARELVARSALSCRPVPIRTVKRAWEMTTGLTVTDRGFDCNSFFELSNPHPFRGAQLRLTRLIAQCDIHKAGNTRGSSEDEIPLPMCWFVAVEGGPRRELLEDRAIDTARELVGRLDPPVHGLGSCWSGS